ncbi:hypothetical protein RFI_10221 [Reticulomyxa filosa]|uniref:Uncharacterized protein n=1 Tax=Reticulomyxa filosa TaxID=46433 RepID=X6NLZ1_RETFI|nr:hypothetical protein RFI_10221 [Reticulomyxa filosa]|eukprot:ETO26918.1 hypothetical protein RFI_10221 [Reticulomyxa filosa]
MTSSMEKLAYKKSTGERGHWHRGQPVKVYSVGLEQWCPGEIFCFNQDEQGLCLDVRYWVEDQMKTKFLDPSSDHLRPIRGVWKYISCVVVIAETSTPYTHTHNMFEPKIKNKGTTSKKMDGQLKKIINCSTTSEEGKRKWLKLQWRMENAAGQSQLMSKELARFSFWVRYRYPSLEDELPPGIVFADEVNEHAGEDREGSVNADANENEEREEHEQVDEDKEQEIQANREKDMNLSMPTKNEQKNVEHDDVISKPLAQINGNDNVTNNGNANSNGTPLPNGNTPNEQLCTPITATSAANHFHNHNHQSICIDTKSEQFDPLVMQTTPQTSHAEFIVPTDWKNEKSKLLEKIAALETEIEMKDQQIQNEEETSEVLLKELELKKHTIVELERELYRLREKITCLKEHIKKQSQANGIAVADATATTDAIDAVAGASASAGAGAATTADANGDARPIKESFTEMSEDDRKSSHSSLIKNNKTIRFVDFCVCDNALIQQIVQQSNKMLREENKTLKEKLKETETSLKLKTR